jgi:hypothetical protein
MASPLSTSLSTMVQDLKRGHSVRRRESLLALAARERERDGQGFGEEGIAAGLVVGEPLSRRRTRDSANVNVEDGGVAGAGGARTPTGGKRMGRGRSLSALSTLSGLWRGIRGQSSREDMRGEEGGRRGSEMER